MISVCVDDYGLHVGINQAALNLADMARVSAISCLVNGPAWHRGCHALKEHADNVEIGLHLNFTEDFGQNLVCATLPKLVVSAYMRRLDCAAIEQDIVRQLDHFELSMHREPDFIDGHQHVHQLPVIRDALIKVLDQRGASRKPWLRATFPPECWADVRLSRSAKRKSSVIGWLGAAALSRLAKRHGYRQNRHLLGVYGFDASESRYLHKLRAWFTSAGDGDVLMCHPSLTGPWDDPLLGSRYREYRVLSGDAFSTLTESAGIEIGFMPVSHSHD